jgi:hypothetical protein
LSGSLRELCTRSARGSRGGPQADSVEQGIEVGDDALIETIEPVRLLERAIKGWTTVRRAQRGKADSVN